MLSRSFSRMGRILRSVSTSSYPIARFLRASSLSADGTRRVQPIRKLLDWALQIAFARLAHSDRGRVPVLGSKNARPTTATERMAEMAAASLRRLVQKCPRLESSNLPPRRDRRIHRCIVSRIAPAAKLSPEVRKSADVCSHEASASSASAPFRMSLHSGSGAVQDAPAGNSTAAAAISRVNGSPKFAATRALRIEALSWKGADQACAPLVPGAGREAHR